MADTDLLQLAHGQLSLWQRLRVATHLKRCANCRARAGQFRLTSGLTAARLGDPRAAPWMPARPPHPFLVWLATLPGKALLLFLVLLTVGLIFLGMHQMRAGTTAISDDRPCRPNAPSDQCR